ncbi:SulP family inorganic anion transporter [Actinomadura madurae]|uniref:SulP family inorganic anion transporter n=1 Tax=Actinomadura madurae TaxID=1993 RepID=UPI0020D25130|nr:bifunctional SulP family inorganic anion transporter/carbonic anhydrase [Actinomadura madurae]MCP9949275.1 bifunctional SulP family inorganic anion transporter/carbonic anhydrase [Actinomadura madurae]MCP9978514.1 bifunctional SulP family inorganic anion transporter/carbonic anhydrase [Actinomadura madurae]MCQ0009956.1 bifunctional SulP family inorganic anion transporter/carbonic anhydrase [Actinomadura madurae]MCQ0014719.1 bifunctional SulP family inorganic anion transporter/carbonic anhydr
MTTKPLNVSSFRQDLLASFVVFLVAIPLSLGIAVASGAPVAAGLIAAVAGGIVAGLIGGSPLQVSGPAAGLTVIVAELIQTYGWRATCMITMLGGLLQLALGAVRVARAAFAVSPAVVHGMLAGVGAVLVLAQVHVVLGGSPERSAVTNLRELPGQLAHPHTHPALLGGLTILVLLIWSRLPRGGWLRLVPGPLPAIALATAAVWALGWNAQRVDLPDTLFGDWHAPVLPQGDLPGIVGAVLSVALVAAVESLLCGVAIDRARPAGVRHADLDRELIGQGAGNTVSGLLGGLPIAGVIVRSTANLEAGARSRASSVLHGVWVLVLALSCGPLIEQVPLPALAALLIVLGVKLMDTARVRDLRHHREAPAYYVTFAGVVLLGLGEGVLLGIAVMAVLALRRLTRLTVRAEHLVPEPGDAPGPPRVHVVVEGTLTFLGVPKATRVLQDVPAGSSVDLDLNVDFMDHAAFDAIHQWRLAHERQGGRVDIDEIHEAWYERAVTGEMSQPRKTPPHARWWAPWGNRRRRSEAELDAPDMSPADVLLNGVREYHGRTARLVRPIMAELAMEQKPEHLFITCVDSRVVPNIITASGPGDLFINRNVGALVPRHGTRTPDDSVAATVEYATNVLDIRTITVCGHSNCGAMAALLAGGTEVEHLEGLSRWLKHGNHSLARFLAEKPSGDEPPLTRLCKINVMQQLDNLLTYPWLRERVESGEIELVGLYLDLQSAIVEILDRPTGTFVRVPDEIPDSRPLT